MDSPNSLTSAPRSLRAIALALVILVTVVARLWLIRHFPEPDTDVPGHMGIARALLSDPTNVAIHWVWLPAYHFFLAGLLLVGLTANAIRVLNCVLAALVPVALYGYARSTADRSGGVVRHVPWMAAILCAVSPLVNLLGTSAQQETIFTLLILGAVWSIDVGRVVLAGAILAVASLIRYETWGAVALLVGLRIIGLLPQILERLPERVARAFRLPLVVSAPSLLAVGAWLLAHKLREGEWLGFLRELYRYTHAQRDALHRGVLWFPIQQPMFVFGWVVAILFFVGLRRAWRPSHVVPLGIYLFLLGAYVFKGALGSARYYESLTPFVALSAAHGIGIIGERRRWIAPALFAAASWQLVSLSTQLCRWTWPTIAGAEAPPTPSTKSPGSAPRVGPLATTPGARPPGRTSRR